MLRVEGLGKRYQLGHREQYGALRDVITRTAAAPLRRLRGQPATGRERGTFWALQDVSFELRQGEVLGIIGHNGAGKSTLLKILSRITTPTTGRATLAGRVGALLEVGSGFHPELTARENILLNGIILGMRREEVLRKFDEIVEFAGMEEFIDLPVKRYSSGMFTRLAFAVAAHLEPEILIVDEVLAVGDAAFQAKSLGKMSDAAKGGRTILFVSHNMVAVQGLCNRAIWLDHGRVMREGAPVEIVTEYLQTARDSLTVREWPGLKGAPGDDIVRLRRAAVRPAAGQPGEPIDVRTPITLEFEYAVLHSGARLDIAWQLYNEQDIMVFRSGPVESGWHGQPYPAGVYRASCAIPGDLLNNGFHRLELQVIENSADPRIEEPNLLVFDVLDSPELRGNALGRWPGAVRPLIHWNTIQLEDELPLRRTASQAAAT